jgi:signal transduction histidine kinase/ligand-binding sensor domain-containing protein
MIHCRTSIIFLLLLFAQHSFSQVGQPYFNIVRGTSTFTLGKVNSMAQDKYGYMWFTDQTNGCVVRYDGYQIKTYYHDPADSNSIRSLGLECLVADRSGNIWVDAPNGVDKFDNLSNKFIHYIYPHPVNNFSPATILVDHNGFVWLGTSEGLYRLDPNTRKFTHYAHSDNDISSLSCNVVRSLYEDRAGILWVGTGFEFDGNANEGGLNKFNNETGTFTRYLHDPKNPNSLLGNKVRAIFEDRKGNFWVGTDNNGLHLMNQDKGTFTRLIYDPLHPDKLSSPPPKNTNEPHHITFIKEDILGKIWIGTYSEGITLYDPQSKSTERFDSSDKKRPGGYTDNSTWSCAVSKDGEVWISNESNELFRVDPYQTGFMETKLGVSATDFMEDDSSSLWIATNGHGLIVENAKKGLKRTFSHDPSDSFSISSNDNGGLRQKSPGQLWVCSHNGANLLDQKTGKFKRYFYNPAATDPNSLADGVFDVIETKNETYFGLFDRLAVKNNETGLIQYYKNNPADTNSIAKGGVVKFLDNGDGKIWMCVWDQEEGALDLFNTATKRIKHYLKGLIIWRVFKSGNGKLWVGSSKGLYYRNDSLDIFVQAGADNQEFKKTRIKSIAEDAKKNIWGVSASGIFRYDPRTDQVYVFGHISGTSDVGAAPYEPSYTTRSGEMYFGNPNGYYKCYAKNVFNTSPPQIIITDFKIDGHSLVPGENKLKGFALEDAKEIILKHNENKISIEFAAIHFSNPEKNIHQFILEGYESEWRDVREEKAAYYYNIPPGHYTFRIKASSNYGVTAEKSIQIVVLPPWWQTWWAFTMYTLLLGVAIWIFIKWRTRALQKEKIILEEKVALRTKELKEEKEIVESTLSELKSTQAQLIQSEKMASLGELTAGIAHEIQNPLNFVNNFSEVSNELIDEMKEELNKGDIDEAKAIAEDVKQNLEKINHHGKRAGDIVRGMLQHSRTSTGVKESTNINALADEYLRLSYHGLRAKDKSFNATMKTDFDETPGKINIIPQDIGRVLLNLFNNAFYAVNEKAKQNIPGYEPTIVVSTKKINNKIEIGVRDNGNGIPQKIVGKIFQPFFTTKPTGQGTGLGLSLSYDIVKAHGGEIKVETKEGEGTKFTVQLPA